MTRVDTIYLLEQRSFFRYYLVPWYTKLLHAAFVSFPHLLFDYISFLPVHFIFSSSRFYSTVVCHKHTSEHLLFLLPDTSIYLFLLSGRSRSPSRISLRPCKYVFIPIVSLNPPYISGLFLAFTLLLGAIINSSLSLLSMRSSIFVLYRSYEGIFLSFVLLRPCNSHLALLNEDYVRYFLLIFNSNPSNLPCVICSMFHPRIEFCF